MNLILWTIVLSLARLVFDRQFLWTAPLLLLLGLLAAKSKISPATARCFLWKPFVLLCLLFLSWLFLLFLLLLLPPIVFLLFAAWSKRRKRYWRQHTQIKIHTNFIVSILLCSVKPRHVFLAVACVGLLFVPHESTQMYVSSIFGYWITTSFFCVLHSETFTTPSVWGWRCVGQPGKEVDGLISSFLRSPSWFGGLEQLGYLIVTTSAKFLLSLYDLPYLGTKGYPGEGPPPKNNKRSASSPAFDRSTKSRLDPGL